MFTLTAVGTLGLAIGANAAIFTLVDTVLLDPLPYRDADRLVVLKGSAPGTRLGEDFNLAPEFFVEYREEADLLESVGSFNFNTYTLRADERVERVLDVQRVAVAVRDARGDAPARPPTYT